jgi:hypothetical protein
MNSANDILAYMSQVGEAGNELSETNNIRELMAQARDNALMAKTGAKASIGEIGGELGVESILGLAKSSLETAGAAAKDAATNFLANKTGLSSETLSKFASGDVEGGLLSAKKDLASKLEAKNSPPVKQEQPKTEQPKTEQPKAEQPKAEQEEPEGEPIISQDEVIARARIAQRPAPSPEDLPEGAGAIQQKIAPSPEELNNGIASDLEAQNQYQEMLTTEEGPGYTPDLELKTISSNVPEDTGELLSSGGSAPAAGAGAGAAEAEAGASSALTDAIPDIIGAGSEALGSALDLSGLLAPIGLLVGILGPIIGGVVSAKEEASHAADVANSLAQQVQVVNPSSQFL